MTDTDETTVEPTELEEETEDLTELSLRNWGLSGQPVTWAWTSWQPVVSTIRAVNTGFGDASAVQSALDVVFPDMGYQAANVCLAHPPTADFVIQEGTVDPEGPPYVAVMRVDLATDEDLDLPDEQVTWDFGDGTPVTHDPFGWEHGYTEPGVYTVTCTIPVAGVLYSTAQEFTAGEPPEADEEPPVAYAARAATTFDDPENPPEEPPMGNAFPNEPVNPSEQPDTEEVPVTGADEEESMDAFIGRLTVAEVLTYAEAHPDEVDAIVTAEEAGKQRAGILDKL